MLKRVGPAVALAALLALGGWSAWQLSTEPSAQPRYQAHAGSTNQKAAEYYPLNRLSEWLTQLWDWSTHDAITFYTLVLAIFTGSLAIVAIFQIHYLRRADETARTSADAARAAADAAVEQSKLAGLQLDLVEKQHGVARHQFFSANRPRLIVHFIERFTEHPDVHASEQSLAVRFRIMNVGTSDAWVTGSSIRLAHFVPGEWPYPDELGGEDLITGDIVGRRRFGVGAAAVFTARSDLTAGLQDAMYHGDLPRGARLCLIGWIVYQDALDNNITTYFCRQYLRGTSRFDPAQNCEWEEAGNPH